MNQLKCEMCGSTDLIKEEGVFVCQSCGIKYSVEEVRKLMVEGIVEVTRTVKVDSSDELKNLYQIARRAKDDSNSESAQKYYDMILVKDPMSWEAAFYVVYFKAMGCKIAEISSAAISVNNCIGSVLKLILDYVRDTIEQKKAVEEVSVRVVIVADMLYDAAKRHYDSIDVQIKGRFVQEYANNSANVTNLIYNLGNEIVKIFGDAYGTLAANAWKEGITKHNRYIKMLVDKEGNKQTIMIFIDKVKKYDPSYIAPNVNTATSGCYIATAVYGSYDCTEVWILRRFRDHTLGETWCGRAFVKMYYATSPTLVKWFGEKEWFKNLCREPLDKLVDKLRREGVEDTPYKDLPW